jgi:hypothetical protein
MDILRNIVGSLTSGVIRLAVTVGILAAVYLFIVKPVLHSTENAVSGADTSLERSLGGAGLNDIGKTLEGVDKQVGRQIQQAFHTAKKNGNPKKLLRCIEHARGNVHRIQRCTVRF